MSGRRIHRRYQDPLDALWKAVARGTGLRVVRSSEVYASTDGRGTLTLGTDETLDADDCLAQMIFHELVHSLVQGPGHWSTPDWGLDNESDRDFVLEHACLRLQAHLADAYGLREVLAPTTDFRAYYDALPALPLSPGDDPAIEVARAALARVDQPPWGPWVVRGLEATSAIVRAVVGLEREAPPDPDADLPSLFATYRPR